MESTEVDTHVACNTKDDGNMENEKASSLRRRCWFLTINNFSEQEEHDIKTHDCEYLKYVVEQGSEKGTIHLHAVIYYKNPRIWPKRFFPRAKIQVTKSFVAACRYVEKAATNIRGPYEFGKPPEQGRRSDLENLAQGIASGEKTSSDIARDAPGAYVRYFRGLKELENTLFQTDRTEKPKVVWIHGEAGVGKTKYVYDNHPLDEIYVKDNTQWWDGYKNGKHKVIIVDDFDGKWPFRDLLRFLDRYPYQGQVKGGYVKINSPFIYFTSDTHPSMYYKNQLIEDDNHYNQLARRIDKIVFMRRKIGQERSWKMPEEVDVEA